MPNKIERENDRLNQLKAMNEKLDLILQLLGEKNAGKDLSKTKKDAGSKKK